MLDGMLLNLMQKQEETDNMKDKKETEEILKRLKKRYPVKEGFLNFETPFQIGIAVLLSAQTTDRRVNIVTKELFKVAGTPEDMYKLTEDEIKNYISSINFFNNKAKNIYKLTKMVMEEYNGIFPDTMEELMKLPGIGRKSANVIMLEGYKNPQGVAIDTHAKRICNKTGISYEKEPDKIEKDLISKIDKKYYFDANHLFVMHGREICIARNPKCNICQINDLCEERKKQKEKE